MDIITVCLKSAIKILRNEARVMLLIDFLNVVDKFEHAFIEFVYENFDAGENENSIVRINHVDDWSRLVDNDHLSWRIDSISLLDDKFYIVCGK